MPRVRTIAAALLAIALLGALARVGMWWVVESVAFPQPSERAGPHLQLVTDHRDLGRIEAGAAPTARFVVANAGREPLVFRPAPRQCCQAELPAATSVPPGRTSEIALPIAWRELAASGRQEFLFLTNDREQPEFRLIVRGTIEQPRRAEHSVLVKKK